MKPAAFDHLAPSTVAEAVAMLAASGDDAKIIAGGQSLAVAMAFRLARPAVLVDLNGIAALDHLVPDGDVLRIGALARHAAFHRPVVAGPLGALLSSVVRHIAHYPIRQRGTFAGSLAHADPASEWCLVATTLEAEMLIAGEGGERLCPARDFFMGTFTTAVGPTDVLVEVRLPLLDSAWRCGFYEVSRRAGDFALAMALIAVKVEGGVVTAARFGIGGVGDRAIRLAGLEQDAIGERPSAAMIDHVAETARDLVDPTADIHGSAEYRKDLVRTVVRRAFQQAVA